MSLPSAYAWLAKESGPVMLHEALKLYGTHETPGSADNPVIMGWAKEVGVKGYTHDSTVPWCGLFVALVAKRAGWDYSPQENPLWALNWAKWGRPSPAPSLGDVLVFKRQTATGVAGHVALYVGEDASAFHCLGGNQSDQVCITRVAKDRLVAARRAPWRIKQPGNIRPIHLAATGSLSTNEA